MRSRLNCNFFSTLNYFATFDGMNDLKWSQVSDAEMFFAEPGVGLGIGICSLTLKTSTPGIYIHSLALGSVAKMDGRLR